MAGWCDVTPVERSKEQAAAAYDKMSCWYDLLAGAAERSLRRASVARLAPRQGERLLEVGPGTGGALAMLASRVGDRGSVHGIDLSVGMLAVARKRLAEERLLDRVRLVQGHATRLPYADATFDGALMILVLDLFATDQMLQVLGECRRVLRLGGRLVVCSLSKGRGRSASVRVYEWFHRRWPSHIDCRPIYVAETVGQVFDVTDQERRSLFGLPVEIVVGRK